METKISPYVPTKGEKTIAKSFQRERVLVERRVSLGRKGGLHRRENAYVSALDVGESLDDAAV